MRYYVFRANGALVADVHTTPELRSDAEFGSWPKRVPQHPQGGKYAVEIYNANSRLPDIMDWDKLGCYFSPKLAQVFRDFCGDENDYFDIVARGPSKNGEVEALYTGVHAKLELDCLDEEKSFFIAVEYNNPKFQGWLYKDMENPVFRDDVVGNHHHFRLKGWQRDSFISEDLAKALRAVKPNNLELSSIEEVFRIHPHTLKEDLFAPRNFYQSALYGAQGWEEFTRTRNYRRRNIDAAYYLQYALPARFKPT